MRSLPLYRNRRTKSREYRDDHRWMWPLDKKKGVHEWLWTLIGLCMTTFILAMDTINHTIRETSFFRQFNKHHTRTGILFRLAARELSFRDRSLVRCVSLTGFMIIVLPHTAATGNIWRIPTIHISHAHSDPELTQRGIIAGKLNGAILTQSIYRCDRSVAQLNSPCGHTQWDSITMNVHVFSYAMHRFTGLQEGHWTARFDHL